MLPELACAGANREHTASVATSTKSLQFLEKPIKRPMRWLSRLLRVIVVNKALA